MAAICRPASPTPSRLALAAARYAAAGWSVLPLAERGKAPLVADGYLGATTDAAVVAKWWTRWPTANIGVRPGAAGYVVADLDGEAGETAAAELGLLAEPTLTVVTGRGRHLWFVRPAPTPPIGNVSLGPGVELRADAGYVVVPPSVHPTGTPYRWVGRVPEALPLPPEALAALLRARSRAPAGRPAADHEGGAVPEAIPEGARNTTLTALAGAMRRRGASAAAILAALRAENAARCRPPLADRELERIARSIAQYPPAPGPAPRPPRGERDNPWIIVPAPTPGMGATR